MGWDLEALMPEGTLGESAEGGVIQGEGEGGRMFID